MVILRATKRVMRALPPPTSSARASDTALGDWYVNRVVVDRKPLLLLMSSLSFLTLLIPARDVRALPDRLADLVADRLRRLGVPPALREAEVSAMAPVEVAATQDRSVLASLVEFGKAVPYHLPSNGWDEATLRFVEAGFAQMPCRLGGRFQDTVFPELRTPELLEGKWLAALPHRVEPPDGGAE